MKKDEGGEEEEEDMPDGDEGDVECGDKADCEPDKTRGLTGVRTVRGGGGAETVEDVELLLELEIIVEAAAAVARGGTIALIPNESALAMISCWADCASRSLSKITR